LQRAQKPKRADHRQRRHPNCHGPFGRSICLHDCLSPQALLFFAWEPRYITESNLFFRIVKMTAPRFSICVFCGARTGTNPAHADAGRATGEMIGANGWRLVYGAGDVGIMGEVARAAQRAGAATMGVIPTNLMGVERGKRDVTQFVITEDMHERKKVMFMNSDAIVVLPGGAGSLDEFFEVLTWAQIGLHKKPIFLVSIDGYWQPLMTLLTHIVDQGFADRSMLGLFGLVSDVSELQAALRATLSARHASNE
jgi:uncharacterized protein (TIGR00730 family)